LPSCGLDISSTGKQADGANAERGIPETLPKRIASPRRLGTAAHNMWAIGTDRRPATLGP